MTSFPWSVAQDALDVSFSVPQTMRLRFTKECFGSDWDDVQSLFHADHQKARVQFWVDRAVVEANPAIGDELQRRLIGSSDRLELTSPVRFVLGGEQIKNQEQSVEEIFRAIDADGLDRRSYVCVIGGGALLDAVGYAAAIAHRGIRLIRFPTTTLAQA